MCRFDYDEDYTTFYTTENPVARKIHRCSECRREIQPGEKYERVFAIVDEVAVTQKTCPHCKAARAWLLRVCRGYVFTEVSEDLREHWNDIPGYRSLWLGRAIVGMRRQWKSFAEEGLLPVLGEPPAWLRPREVVF